MIVNGDFSKREFQDLHEYSNSVLEYIPVTSKFNIAFCVQFP